jgi:DNA repair protein RadC
MTADEPTENKRIQDIPKSLRPREKASSLGMKALSDAELLALFINTGFQGKNAIQIGQRLLDQNGSIAELAKLSVKELSKNKGLGPAKSTLIAAAFEIGVRVATQSIQRQQLNSPDVIYEYMLPMFLGLTQESLRAILLDSKMFCIKMVEISKGTINQTICHPRDILHHAIVNQAAGIILVHNHPSGDPSPSQADITVTSRLQEACELMQIKFHDHLIVGQSIAQKKAYYSFKESGKL